MPTGALGLGEGEERDDEPSRRHCWCLGECSELCDRCSVDEEGSRSSAAYIEGGHGVGWDVAVAPLDHLVSVSLGGLNNYHSTATTRLLCMHGLLFYFFFLVFLLGGNLCCFSSIFSSLFSPYVISYHVKFCSAFGNCSQVFEMYLLLTREVCTLMTLDVEMRWPKWLELLSYARRNTTRV